MSKQLALSSAFAVLTMAAFVLSVTSDAGVAAPHTLADAKVETPAPAIVRIAPAF